MNAQDLKERVDQLQEILKKGKFDEVIKSSIELLEILEKENFSMEKKLLLQVQLYHDLATAYYESRETDKAIEISKKALKILGTDTLKKKLSIERHLQLKMNIRFLISVSYKKKGNLTQAIEKFKETLETLSGERMGEKLTTKQYATKTFTYQILGTIYQEIGEEKEAMEYYEKALMLLRDKIMKKN